MLVLQKSVSNFDCISLKSDISGEGANDEVSQGCTNSNYSTLVSCGFSTYRPEDYVSNGGYMAKVNNVSLCHARNYENTEGVYAHARCCDFRHLGDVECIGTNFGINVGYRKTKMSECDTEYNILTGCIILSNFSQLFGSYPGIISRC